MNVKQTHEYFKANGIVAIRADKGVLKTAGQIDNLLEELGNETRAIPFYAIYPPGGGEPKVLEGLIRSKTVIDIFEKFDPAVEAKSDSKMSKSEIPTTSEIPTISENKEGKNKKVAIRN